MLGTIFRFRVSQIKKFKASRYVLYRQPNLFEQFFYLQVAASDGGNFNGIFSENIIWDEAKSPVQSIKVEKKSTLRKQNSKLLDQMVSVIGSHQVKFS